MTKRQNGLLQDALILLHTDRAMVREGFDQMTDWEIEKVSYLCISPDWSGKKVSVGDVRGCKS